MADVEVTFAASIEQLTESMNSVRFALEGLTDPIRAVRDSMGELAEAFAAAFAVERIAAFMERMAELGTQTQRTAALLGVQTTEVSGLDIAARASGGSLEGMSTALERFGLNLVRGESGSKQQEAALRALGVSAQDFVGIPLPEALGKLADHFAVIKDGVDKDAIAISLLGRSGADMIPIFNQGSGAFEEFAQIAQRTGTAMSQETADGLEQTHLKLIELDKSFQGAGLSIASVFRPAFNGLVQVTYDLVEAFTQSVNEGGAMAYVLVGLTGTVQAVATALAVAIGAIQDLWEITKAAVFSMGEWFTSLGRIIKDAFTFNWSDIGKAWGDLQAQMSARAEITGKNMAEIWKKSVDELKTIWGAGAAEHDKIDQTQTARMQIANGDRVSAAMKAIESQIKLEEEALKKKTLILDGEVKQHQITENQKYGLLEQYTQQAYEAELRLLQQEAQIGGLSLAQHQSIMNKIEQLKAKHEQDMIKLDQQSIAAQQKLYDNFFSSIQTAFNGQLRGLLAGTTTWSQAMRSILGDLLIKFIEYCEKSVFEWAAAELAKTTATTTGAAARATAEATGQSASVFGLIANAVKSIFASAGQTTAEVTAVVAPVAGPAAPAIGAAAGATTLSSALSLLPSLDVGTDLVLRDGLAMIHAGEQVVPAQTSGPFTGGNGNATQLHFYGPFVNGTSQTDIRNFAKSLAKYLNLNPSVRPAY